MRRLSAIAAFLVRCIVIGLAVAFVIALLWPSVRQHLRAGFAPQDGPASAVQDASSAAGNGPVSYARAVQRAAPSVVNIYANRLVTEHPTLPAPLRNMFGPLPTGPAFTRREQSLGSGVIVRSDGYVLTNNHVITGAQNIQVLLYNGRVAQAKVVGADPDTDLAVLKINVGTVPAIHLDTTASKVGDVVLAIGNPLGIGQTVTMGIVSATGRQLGPSNPEQFIQTDAAINFGNSGGALVNAHGDLVGINTALLGHAHGAEGISFAIPTATAEWVLEQIIANGHVTRSWLGITYAHVPIRAHSGLPAATHGVVVTAIYPGGPGDKAGLKAGDVLLQVNGHAIVDPPQLFRYISPLKPGTSVTLAGVRAGKPFRTKVTLSARPQMTRSRGSVQ